jgi:hypothetical protein
MLCWIERENDLFIFVLFPSEDLRFSPIDHCGNGIIARTTDQPIEREKKKE